MTAEFILSASTLFFGATTICSLLGNSKKSIKKETELESRIQKIHRLIELEKLEFNHCFKEASRYSMSYQHCFSLNFKNSEEIALAVWKDFRNESHAIEGKFSQQIIKLKNDERCDYRSFNLLINKIILLKPEYNTVDLFFNDSVVMALDSRIDQH